MKKVSDGTTYHLSTATKSDKVLEILNKYVAELKEMCKDALAASLRALATEFDDRLGISNYATKSFNNWFARWFNSGVRHLEQNGFGNIFTICDRLYGAYEEVVFPMCFAFEGDVDNVKKTLKKHAEKLYNLDLEPDSITDLGVSKALDGVKKARKALIEMIAAYLNDIDPTGVLSFELTSICCPVDVRVLDSTGAEIASVIDGVATSFGRVSVSVVDDMKTILVPLGMSVTFEIVGTGEGTMTCTTEQIVGGVPTGRVNWYDIPVSEGSTFTRALSGGRITEDNPGMLVTEGGSIPPSEWLPLDNEDSYVGVAVSCDEGGLTFGSGDYPRGEIVSVSAAPADEFHGFDGWYAGDEFVSSDATYSFVARGDVTLNARFVPIQAYDYAWSTRLAEEYADDCAMRVRKNANGTHDIVLAMAGMEDRMPSCVTLRAHAADTQQANERAYDVAVENDCCIVVRDVDLSSVEYAYLLSSDSKTIGVVYRTGSEAPFDEDGWVPLPGGGKGYRKNGKLVTGWLDIGDMKYWFHEDGTMARGWTDVEVDGKVMHYYFNPASGNLVRGTWFEIDGYKYYFRPSGNVAHGWATISDNGVDKKYYFDDDYHLVAGCWRDIDTGQGYVAHYYFRPSGSMATGWATIDGRSYWFRESGNMATGFTTVDDGFKRYFDGSGQMLVGWQVIGGKTYHFRPSGAMQTGWKDIDGSRYYFRDSGVMQTGRATIDGVEYEFGDDGVLVGNVGQPSAGVTSVSISCPKNVLRVGEEVALLATCLPAGAQSPEVTWRTSNANVATVDGGVVRGVANGPVTVTAAVEGCASASVVLVVNDYKNNGANDYYNGQLAYYNGGEGTASCFEFIDCKRWLQGNGLYEPVPVDRSREVYLAASEHDIELAYGSYISLVVHGDEGGYGTTVEIPLEKQHEGFRYDKDAHLSFYPVADALRSLPSGNYHVFYELYYANGQQAHYDMSNYDDSFRISLR